MRKKMTFLLVMLTALAASLPVGANSQLTVFDDGYSLSNTSPINLVYIDTEGTRCQTIFPAEALTEMIEEPINSMTFYVADDGITIDGGKVRVSVGETSQTSFVNSYIDDGLVQVATVSMTSGVNQVVITFDTPYIYHGGNLVLDTYIEEATVECYNLFEGVRPDNYSTITRGEVGKFIPKTTFDYGTNADYDAKAVPTELTFNTVRAEREDVQTTVLKNVGQKAFTPIFIVEAPFYVDLEAAPIAAGETLDVPVRFAPTASGVFNGTLSIDCGPAGIHEVALHGEAIGAATDLTVADETDYASYVPIYGADIDIVGTMGQVIYPDTMLTDMVGGDILGLKFHTYKTVQMDGGVIQMSLKTVDHGVFTDAVAETGLTVVATVTPVFGTNDLEFVFDQPFHYEGGNLLVECLVVTAGTSNYKQTFFWGTPLDEAGINVGLYRSSNYYGGFETALVPFLPEATFSYSKDEPSVLRGDVNQDQSVNITDVTSLINLLLKGGEKPAEADCNLDQSVNITDVTTLINFLLKGEW